MSISWLQSCFSATGGVRRTPPASSPVTCPSHSTNWARPRPPPWPAACAGSRSRRWSAAPCAVVGRLPRRCWQNASQAAGGLDDKPLVEARFAEAGYGDWTGRSIAELAEEPLWRVVQQTSERGGLPRRGEPGRHGRPVRGSGPGLGFQGQRGVRPDALWLACSHADVIKAVAADALGLHLDQFQRIVVEPASLTVIRYTETQALPPPA